MGPVRVESICLSEYPNSVIAWDSPSSEKSMIKCQEAASGLRSLFVQLKVTGKQKPNTYLFTSEDNSFTDDEVRVTGCLARIDVLKAVSSNTKNNLPGVLQSPVSPVLNVGIQVEGLDLSGELKNIDKKKAQAEKFLGDVKKKTQIADYDTKTPAAIKEKNQEKISALEKELEELENSRGFITDAMGGK